MASFEPNNTRYLSRRNCRGNKGKIEGSVSREVCMGDYAVKFVDSGRILPKHMETVRKLIVKECSKKCNFYFRIFPQKSFSLKSSEARRGGGKGTFEGWYCPVKSGEIFFEIDGVEEKIVNKLFDLVRKKLPIFTTLVKRNQISLKLC